MLKQELESKMILRLRFSSRIATNFHPAQGLEVNNQVRLKIPVYGISKLPSPRLKQLAAVYGGTGL
jgi:hypothetical protein